MNETHFTITIFIVLLLITSGGRWRRAGFACRERLEVSSLEEIQTEILAAASVLSPEGLLALERALLAL